MNVFIALKGTHFFYFSSPEYILVVLSFLPVGESQFFIKMIGFKTHAWNGNSLEVMSGPILSLWRTSPSSKHVFPAFDYPCNLR